MVHRRSGSEPLVFLLLVCGIIDNEVWFAANAFGSSSVEKGKGLPLVRESEERELDARRASIECKNYVGHGSFSVSLHPLRVPPLVGSDRERYALQLA